MARTSSSLWATASPASACKVVLRDNAHIARVMPCSLAYPTRPARKTAVIGAVQFDTCRHRCWHGGAVSIVARRPGMGIRVRSKATYNFASHLYVIAARYLTDLVFTQETGDLRLIQPHFAFFQASFFIWPRAHVLLHVLGAVIMILHGFRHVLWRLAPGRGIWPRGAAGRSLRGL